MLLSHKPKFLFLLAPKTATSSLTQWFVGRYHARHVGQHHGLNPAVLKKHASYPVLISCRNPYTRLTSWWRYLQVRQARPKEYTSPLYQRVRVLKQPFAAFLREEMAKIAAGEDSLLLTSIWEDFQLSTTRIDHVLRQESLQQDLRKLPFPVPAKIKLPRIRRTMQKQPWFVLYRDAPDIVQFVQTHYAEDFRYFSYSPDLLEAILRSA